MICTIELFLLSKIVIVTVKRKLLSFYVIVQTLIAYFLCVYSTRWNAKGLFMKENLKIDSVDFINTKNWFSYIFVRNNWIFPNGTILSQMILINILRIFITIRRKHLKQIKMILFHYLIQGKRYGTREIYWPNT